MQPGIRLGHYEIHEAIGRGGMGEVWRARDTKLGRDVAVKTLPPEFADDADRLARFEREAQLLASLNHPNIAAIYGLEEHAGSRFLVLELVEGDTLADRIGAGAIPVGESLRLGLQIAEALECAHGKSVVHRDLKPGNIKITPNGTVKVLDFGLAKALGPGPGDENLSSVPTLDPQTTQPGTVLGTVAYMSPEQARGTPVDKRADIWSFACVLFEMLAGSSPFHGETPADTLAHVLGREPDWEALPEDTPPLIGTLLQRCLRKVPQERLPDIGAARIEISEALDSTDSRRPSPFYSEPRRRFRWEVAGVALAGVIAVVGWLTMGSEDPTPVGAAISRVSVDPSPGESWVISPHDPDFAIAPDGSRIAYIGRRGEENELVIRSLDEFEGVSLGSFGGVVRHPFFSPDGTWVGFVDGNTLKKAAVDGDRVVTICALPGYASGASWGTDDVITFGTLNSGLFRVPSAGGEPEPLPTRALGEGRNARWPEVLPGDEAVLFASVGVGADSEIRVLSLASLEERVIVQAASFPRYAPSGHLLYVSGGGLWGVRFDPQRLEVVSDPELLVESILIKGPPQTGIGAADVAIASNGTLVYRPAGGGGGDASALVWVNRDGSEEPLPLESRAYGRMQLSPNGSRIAIEVADAASGNTDIWVGDWNARLSQLTFDPGVDDYPVWTPDGERVIFRSERGAGGIYVKRADGAGPDQLLQAGLGPAALPYFTTPDPREVIYLLFNVGYFGIGLDDGVERPLDLLRGPVAAISPDERWMAYSSEETGNFEVYVQPYPNPDNTQWRITTSGGRDPVWSRDGGELFYQNDTTTFAVEVTPGAVFRASPPIALFDGPYVDALGRWYDVAPDGRFLMLRPGWLSAGQAAPLNVVLNWFQELATRLPGR